MRSAQSESMFVMANVQIRGVPDAARRPLNDQAAPAGQSRNEYLLSHLTAIASTPTIPQLIERLRELPHRPPR